MIHVTRLVKRLQQPMIIGLTAAGVLLGGVGIFFLSATSAAAIPPIDTAAPMNTQTATFALG